MLEKLSPNQMELAFKWLESPIQCPPPPELESLSQMEWFLLDRMLQQLLKEKESQRVQ
jgi:hypothetical protein